MHIQQNLMQILEQPVVGLITEWIDKSGEVEQRTENSDLGGTMRVGSQNCHLRKGSKVFDMYGQMRYLNVIVTVMK